VKSHIFAEHSNSRFKVIPDVLSLNLSTHADMRLLEALETGKLPGDVDLHSVEV